MTNPDYRAMCAELVELSAPVDSISQLTERLQKLNELADRARALLAEPVAEGPTDEELLASVRHFYGDQTAADMGAEDDLRTARAVLARWGRPVAQPVAVAPYREVDDLVGWLEDHSVECLELDQPEWSQSIAQAARFLHLYLKATPQPVAISERLPGPEDCDVEGRCWLWERDCGYSGRKWALVDRPWSLSQSDEDLSVYTHWLPANALPLPKQEVSK